MKKYIRLEKKEIRKTESISSSNCSKAETAIQAASGYPCAGGRVLSVSLTDCICSSPLPSVLTFPVPPGKPANGADGCTKDSIFHDVFFVTV